MVDTATLLTRLEGIYQRLVLGDRATAGRVAAWKKRAKAGDPKAKVAYNTLAVLHWRQKDPAFFARAEVFYNRLMAREPGAHAQLKQIVAGARARQPGAARMFATLKAVHHKRKASLWTLGTGSPRTGYHPMPNMHRAGIEIPGLGNVVVPQIPGVNAPNYLPLTPASLVSLLSLIQQALMSVPGRPFGVRDSFARPGEASYFEAVRNPLSSEFKLATPINPMMGPQGTALSSVPKSSVVTTVMKPSTLSSIRQAATIAPRPVAPQPGVDLRSSI